MFICWFCITYISINFALPYYQYRPTCKPSLACCLKIPRSLAASKPFARLLPQNPRSNVPDSHSCRRQSASTGCFVLLLFCGSFLLITAIISLVHSFMISNFIQASFPIFIAGV
ncbi:hypothetical protein HanPSC8_Chr17g0781381 [Helianthus annuus]|nr:hypothetical protein HanPSC8_Chr17g0781381 [Helianthus annuus]